MPNPRDLKSENIGSMPPAARILERTEVGGLGRHGDDPRLGMPSVMDDADVGPDALAGERHVLEVVHARKGQIARRRLARADPGLKVALESETVVPPAILTPPDQVGRSV